MRYEIIERSVETGAVRLFHSGYLNKEDAEEAAEYIEKNDPTSWCEVREER